MDGKTIAEPLVHLLYKSNMMYENIIHIKCMVVEEIWSRVMSKILNMNTELRIQSNSFTWVIKPSSVIFRYITIIKK